MTDYAFCGTESLGFWLGGHLSRARAIELAGADHGFVATDGDAARCRAALLVVRIEGLRTWRLPFPRWTYPEAVWLLALGEARYLAVRAHASAWMVPMLSRMDRYNTAAASLALDASPTAPSLRVAASDAAFEAILTGTPRPSTSRLIASLWTRDRAGGIFRIPWGGDAPAQTSTMACRIARPELGAAIFGADVVWDADAVLFRDRPHRCAPAVREAMPGTGHDTGSMRTARHDG